MIRLVPIAEASAQEVEALLDAAFGPDRHGRTAYRLRAGTVAIGALSFAAFEGERLVGTLQSWPIEIAGEERAGGEPLILVGPVAVRPDRQRDGIGRMLMARLIEAADSSGADPLAMIGDPEYYGRFFGFSAQATGGWEVPGPVERHRLLARIPAGRHLPATGLLRPRAIAAAPRAA